jgi:RNA methyltransferase, TrmH family
LRSEAAQRLRRLVASRSARWEQRRFVVEGAKLVGEALASGATIEAVYIDGRGATAAHRELAARCRSGGAEVFELQPGLLARACDTVTPQAIAAVVSMIDVPLSSVMSGRPVLAVACVEMQDPGNAGVILRSAGASGAAAVVFSAGSVDVYNPKTVRSSAGALFHVPVVAGEDRAEEILDELGRSGLRRMGTVVAGGREYTEEDLVAPLALVLGNESRGLPPALGTRLDGLLTIPMAGMTESLNVGVAAAVICFEAARQRRASGSGRRGSTPGIGAA